MFEKWFKTNMKKLLIYILYSIVCVSVLAGILFFYVNGKRSKIVKVSKLPVSDAIIYFTPPSLRITSNGETSTHTVDIDVQSKAYPLSGAQTQLLYDPDVIKNVKLTPSINT